MREKACPLFVPLVEEGWAEHPVTEQVAKIYLSEAFAGDAGDFNADVLVLGMYALSTDQAAVAASGAGAYRHRGLSRIHGAGGGETVGDDRRDGAFGFK